MSRPGALLLITAGVALGSHYLFPSPDFSGDLAEITRISVAPDRDYRESAVIPTFAPTTPTYHEVVANKAEEPVARPLPKPSAWTTVVISGRSVVSPIKSTRAADTATRAQLTRDLQRELQRVGCYQGELTGTWNLATRRAMAAFMDRANAVLPYTEPDYVLLALVQSHSEIACSAECPSGQAMDDGGRCVPQAVIAQAAKRSKRLEDQRTAEARLAEDRDRAMTASASEPPQPEVLPWLKNQAARQPQQQVAVSPLAEITLAPRSDPLPGRMSIGGPPIDLAPTTPVAPAAQSPVELNAAPKLAALQDDPDADDLSGAAGTASTDAPPIATDVDGTPHKAKKSRHSDREGRPRRESYAYSGKRRHGQPSPGTARFNLMQSLGGIY